MVHVGHNIAKLRGIRRLPQKDMATKLKMTQQEYSRLEKSEAVDEDKLALIAEALGVTAEVIKNFNDETAINIFSNNTLSDHATIVSNQPFYSFNPMDKIIELVEKNELLYRQLLKEKDTVIEIYKQQQKTS